MAQIAFVTITIACIRPPVEDVEARAEQDWDEVRTIYRDPAFDPETAVRRMASTLTQRTLAPLTRLSTSTIDRYLAGGRQPHPTASAWSL